MQVNHFRLPKGNRTQIGGISILRVKTFIVWEAESAFKAGDKVT